MENRRNSGSYSSRVANPPLQPLPDGYAQKRASYRRPIEPQPTPTQDMTPADPPPPNGIPSNAARPIAPAPTSNGVSRTSSHRRRHSQQIPPPVTGAGAEPLLAAPDVPRGPPPTSYRDPYAPKSSSRSGAPTRSYSGRSRDPTIYTNASRQQPNVQIAPSRLQELRATAYKTDAVSGTIEGDERRGSQGRRPSVPDRSPLQTLEGKLDDISKEERRARILEAELAAQEKAEAERAARRVREAAAKQQQRNVSGPVSTSDRRASDPSRTKSTRRHASMPVQSAPRSQELVESDDDDPLYDISEPWDPTARVPKNEPLTSGVYTSGSIRQKNRPSAANAQMGRTPSTKGKEPVGVAQGNSFRERAGAPRGLDEAEQTPRKIERKPVAQPTGLGLVGIDDPSRQTGPTVSRYDSKKLTKDLPPTPLEDGSRRDSRGIAAAQMEMEQKRWDQKQTTRGFDHLQNFDNPPPPAIAPNRRAVGFAPSVQPAHQLNEPEETVVDSNPLDVFHHEQDRRYVPTPMLDEWRTAPTGALLAEDLDLDIPEKTDTNKKTWWEENPSSRRRRSSGHAQPVTSFDGYVDEPSGQTSFNPPLYLKCGPLLRYTGIRKDKNKNGRQRDVWRGSVMIVTVDDQSSYQKPPVLRLFKQSMDLLPPPPVEIDGEGQNLNPDYVDPIEGQIKVGRNGETLYAKPIEDIAEGLDLSRVEGNDGLFQVTRTDANLNGNNVPKSSRVRKKDGEKVGKLREIPGVRLHAERGVTFWRFNLEIELSSTQTRIAYRINRGPAVGFWVPARGDMMNIMFHSCNGFSLSVDPKDFCGPDPMWRDVLNNHQTRPFHVMIGGGDQIYNDAAMRQTTLFRQWTESRNPLHKHNAGFSAELQNELEQFYLDRYSMWFSQGLFGMANSQIPMVNIWDDHDIIDGYGSYPHHFMQTPVFTGLGAVAFKYYLLFQHQSVAAETDQNEPSWLLGAHPGPYIKEQSRSVFMSLGRGLSLLGLDCRTERQRNEILTEDSYDVIFDRLEAELVKGEAKHLIVLLGVPIAYPRLNFLENVLTSRFMDPIKALGRTGVLGGFVNKFDGGVEILDDLDDHWTAKHHKDERNWFIRELQHIAKTKSVRVTILGGDVHLAAVGQFFTNRKLGIPKDKDYRYMPNVVSSAIVNTPPPDMMADVLNKRNKVHHLDPFTDEDMIPLFTHDVDGKKRNNTHLLPRRNWCGIREYKPGTTPPSSPSPPATPTDGPRLSRTLSNSLPGNLVRRMSGAGKRGRDSGPPVAYYNNPAYAAAEEDRAAQSAFSPEPPEDERPRSRRLSISSLFRRRASVDSIPPPGSSRSVPTPHRSSFARDDSLSRERPSAFHRRPSLVGRKKTMKQTESFINLEGGLDICLNLEVSQKDPAGITMPYRLLVPTLDYTEPATAASTGPTERRKSRIGSWFGGLGGGRRKRTIGEDGYSRSGSEAESDAESDQLGEVDEEERARQRYKVGPRILIPGITRRRDKEKRYHSQPTSQIPRYAESPSTAPAVPSYQQPVSAQHTRGDAYDDYEYDSVPPDATNRRTSAPMSMPHRSASSRNPTHNSSHKSQLPAPPEVHRRSMGGILNQHGGDRFEHDAHVLAHTPSTHGHANANANAQYQPPSAAAAAAAALANPRSKRESYPPHPAIVGAGPGSPYGRGAIEAREDTGGYFSGAAARSGSRDAGVGARYLGGGRYEGEEEDGGGGRGGEEDGVSPAGSVSSFEVPKKKAKWKIWK
ncbi:hypothetical protein EJ04DRAFT_84306 [Polyplosphaeria fusca]|uniref:PhoD-like phosphatase domain-containing protein n=1 Tax=Polyplosphaeria fusca TaxID=682080 RepID=A0A9P4QPX2_9PLEO|nr:hypothetical protein EJ04DRAFT_84306 [Polyplosphaeria fusca]